jgi:hypothetical protein
VSGQIDVLYVSPARFHNKPQRGLPCRMPFESLAVYLSRPTIGVAKASDGERHYTLSKEAFCLARLDLTEREIALALVPAFVAVAGEPRRREGERTVRDAIAARGAA